MRSHFGRFSTLAFILLLSACSGSSETADLILTQGNVITMDEAQPRAQAIAIKGEKILAVGSNEQIDKLRGPQTEVIDLEGRTVVPGLVDGHLHFSRLGADTSHIVELDDSQSLEEALTLIKRRAQGLAPGEWLTGRGWHVSNWGTERWPTASDLDRVVPNNPASFVGMHSHASWLNSKALQAANITRDRADPEDGIIQRDPETGKPNGILIENAQWLVSDVIPEVQQEPLKESIRKSIQLALSYGFTGAHDLSVSVEVIQAYRELVAEGDFPFRLNLYARIWRTGELLDSLLADGPIIAEGNHRLSMRAIKLSIDGALGARGAALLAPYSDEPQSTGVIRVPPDQVYEIVRQSLQSGFTAALHAIGDRANRIALDAVEKILQENPLQDHRVRIEHAQIVALEDIPRFAQLGVIASFQWMHSTLDMPWAEKRVGPERIQGGYAWRTFLDAGVRIIGGSDEGRRTFSPFMGIHAAVTRQDQDGNPPGGWYPEQRLSRIEALRSYTLDAAYASFEEDVLGSITPGKFADVAVFSRDILSVAPEEILETEAVMTLVGGKVVFDRNHN